MSKFLVLVNTITFAEGLQAAFTGPISNHAAVVGEDEFCVVVGRTVRGLWNTLFRGERVTNQPQVQRRQPLLVAEDQRIAAKMNDPPVQTKEPLIAEDHERSLNLNRLQHFPAQSAPIDIRESPDTDYAASPVETRYIDSHGRTARFHAPRPVQMENRGNYPIGDDDLQFGLTFTEPVVPQKKTFSKTTAFTHAPPKSKNVPVAAVKIPQSDSTEESDDHEKISGRPPVFDYPKPTNFGALTKTSRQKRSALFRNLNPGLDKLKKSGTVRERRNAEFEPVNKPSDVQRSLSANHVPKAAVAPEAPRTLRRTKSCRDRELSALA